MAKIKSNNKAFTWILIVLPYIIFPFLYFVFVYDWDNLPQASVVIINKSDMTLKAYDQNGKIIQQTSVATGKFSGNKTKIGDMKTPEGVFTIADIQDASTWSHDFKDDSLGSIKGAYGPFFIRLNVPEHKGIGIHGTHDPSSIGKNVTEGCIRLQNEEIVKLQSIIKPGIPVVILPGKAELIEKILDNSKRNHFIKNGSTN